MAASPPTTDTKESSSRTRREPVWRGWSAERTLTARQRLVGVLAVLGLGAAGWRYGATAIAAVLLGATTLVFLVTSVLRITYMISGHRAPGASRVAPPPLARELLPPYSVMVALYHEAQVVPELLASLGRLDYPQDRLQVLLLVEHDDPETDLACREHLRPGWEVVVVPPGAPRTKPRALNVALPMVAGEYFTIYDAEDRPERDQLLKAVEEFRVVPARVAALQARLDFYNSHENTLTKWFTCDYASHFGLNLAGIAAHRHPMPLGGTSTHFRTGVIRDVGGWDAWNVTEDCELGMRLSAAGHSCATLDSVTWEEAVPRLGAWIKQRSRWVKGYAQTGLVLLRAPLRTARAMGLRSYLASLATVSALPVVLLTQVVSWTMLIVYVVMRVSGADVRPIEQLFPEPLLSLGMASLLLGNFAILLAQVSEIYREQRYDLVGHALTIPVYWLLTSLGAARGVFQMLRRPHFWEKTRHGLTDQTGAAGGTSRTRPLGALSLGTDADAATVPWGGFPAPQSATPNEVAPASQEAAAARRSLDRWLLAGLAIAAVGLGVAYVLLSRRGEIVGFGDSVSHILIARRVIDGTDPGFRQLGVHWLPLLHVLELPFVWIGPVYRSGASGSIVSGLASLVTVAFVYRLALLVGAPRLSALLGAVMLAVGPNFLYAGVIPMQPAVIMAAGTANIYFLTKWALSGEPAGLLVMAGLTLSLATLAHFDTWPLVVAEPLIVIALVHSRRREWPRTLATAGVWALAGGYGIAAFLTMNVLIFGQPLAFLQTGLAYGTAPGAGIPVVGGLEGVSAYPRAALIMAGPALAAAGLAGLALFSWRNRRSPRRLLPLLLFYPLVLYMAQGVRGSYIVPGPRLDEWQHLRYAVTILPALAFFAAVGFSRRVPALIVALAVLAGYGLLIDRGRVAMSIDARIEGGAKIDRQWRPVAERLARGWKGRGHIYLPTVEGRNDRFVFLTGLSPSRFIDATSKEWRALRRRPGRARALGVEWVVRVGYSGIADFDRAVRRTGARECPEVRLPDGSLPIVIYTLNGSCPLGGRPGQPSSSIPQRTPGARARPRSALRRPVSSASASAT